ncbi:SRPBCC domain-containing protein [Streptomyces apocyni]|uniref:SRPBCC domain-containing protein n=1 Tax=Streptomyces apocyni TaxID=2654677 RepID=UPI0012E9FCA8|nr:SRPBCC domain-containing protein [Streptomyces apocyni]
MTGTIGQGTSTTTGDARPPTQHLHFELHLPHAVEKVWAAVATPEGLVGWLAAADVLEPRLGGAVTLRWLNADPAHAPPPTHSGRITAWDVERIVEYTFDGPPHGRARFHLEPLGVGATTLRFTNEFPGDDALRLDCLAGWHQHFEFLLEALEGRPMDAASWSAWSRERWQQLRDGYAESPGAIA